MPGEEWNGSSTTDWWWEFRLPTQLPLTPFQKREWWMPCYYQAVVDIKVATEAHWCEIGERCGVFPWCISGVEQVLSKKISLFPGYSFPDPLARESRLFLGIFFLCLLLFSGCSISSIQTGIYRRLRKTRRTYHYFILWVPRYLASPIFLSTSQRFFFLLLLLVLYMMSRVFSCTMQKKSEEIFLLYVAQN